MVIAAEPAVTFHKDVEPVLQRRCQGCHRPGEAAPFSLLTYQSVRPWAKSIRQAVVSRKMPPWFADPAHGSFANDRRLSSSEIETIRAWVDGGAPEGDQVEAPPKLAFTDDWKIGKPDLIVEIPSDFPVPASGTIDYTWFAMDPKLTEDKWIEKVEVRPGNRAVVHHTLAFARPPGSKVFDELAPGQTRPAPDDSREHRRRDEGVFAVAGGFGDGLEMIGDYVPNGDPYIATPGQARLIRAGSHILFQMHYTTNGKATTDRTRIGFVFAKKPPKERVVNEAVANMGLRIPPGAGNHPVVATVTFHHDTEISGFGPHMHLRGKAMRMELLRAGQDAPETLLYVPAYDFNWQLKYQPQEWVQVKKGDRMRVTAWYDNSPNNRYNPDPTREVYWGDQSWDEMLFAFFDFVIPADARPEMVTGSAKSEPRASR